MHRVSVSCSVRLRSVFLLPYFPHADTKEERIMKNPMINPCAVWAKKLADTRLDNLSPSEQTALLAHLEKCAACAAIRLEYQLMDSRIRSYPAQERLLHQSPLMFMPEYESHRLRLLLSRQAERNHGSVLIVAGTLFFLLVLIFLTPLFLHYQSGFPLVIMVIAGTCIPMYFLWNGLVSIFSSLRPVTIKEVKERRHQARRVGYLQARGEPPPDLTFKKNMRVLLIESALTVSGGFILLLRILNSMPVHGWVYILVLTIECLIECLLILDTLYFAPKQTRDLPARNPQELSQLLIIGEATIGEEPWEQKQEEQ